MNDQLSEIRITRYRDKCSSLRKYYNYTRKWFVDKENFSLKDNESGHHELFSIYHAIQLSIEIIIDLSAMIVKDIGQKPLDNYRNINILKEKGIIPEASLPNLYNLFGLRNRITHDYNGLIDEIALESYMKNHKYIMEYINRVEKWINQNSLMN